VAKAESGTLREGTRNALACNAEPLSTGGQHRQERAGAQQCLDQLCAGVQQVLAVVQHQEQTFGAQYVDTG
jgi:hypothetical protein